MNRKDHLLEVRAATHLNFEQSRRIYRKAARRALVDHMGQDVAELWGTAMAAQSPLFSDPPTAKTVKVRPTLTGLLDVLDAWALLWIAVDPRGQLAAEPALLKPSEYGTPGASRTGYRVGYHRAWSDAAISAHLSKECAKEGITPAEIGRKVKELEAELAPKTKGGATTPAASPSPTTPATTTNTTGATMANAFDTSADVTIAGITVDGDTDGNAVIAYAASASPLEVFPVADLLTALIHDADVLKATVGRYVPDSHKAAFEGWWGMSIEALTNVMNMRRDSAADFEGMLADDDIKQKYSERTRTLAVMIAVAENLLGQPDNDDAFGSSRDDNVINFTEMQKRLAKWQGLTIEPNIGRAIDSLLSGQKEGASVAAIIADLNEAAQAMVTAQQAIVQARNGAQVQTVINFGDAATVAGHDGSVPDCTPSTMKAWELFTPAGPLAEIKAGRKAPMDSLDFDFPVFPEWMDGKHPDVDPIDPDYLFDPDTLVPLLWALLHGKPTWLYGHTGTGKSTLIKQVSARTGWPCLRVNMDSEITRMDFVGRDTLVQENGATVSRFVEGILPQAMQRPCIMLTDEIDFGRSDIMYVYQSVLEADGMRLTEDGGRWIRPHPMFRIVATANTKGQGDEYGCYQGARVQSAALLDRFQVWVHIPYLSPKTEARLIMAKVPGLPESRADQLVKVAGSMRKAFVNAEILTPASPRGLMTAAALYMTLRQATKDDKAALQAAIKVTLAGKASDVDRTKIDEFVRATVV